MKNLWTGTTTRFGRESGVYVLNTWVRRGTPDKLDFVGLAM